MRFLKNIPFKTKQGILCLMHLLDIYFHHQSNDKHISDVINNTDYLNFNEEEEDRNF